MQFLCKDYPEVARFETPYLQWRCDTRSYCAPAWHAQFPYDGRECKPMIWDETDDASTVARPMNCVPPRMRTRGLDIAGPPAAAVRSVGGDASQRGEGFTAPRATGVESC